MLKKIFVLMTVGILVCSICCHAEETVTDEMTETVWILLPEGDTANETEAELRIRNEEGLASFVRLSDMESINACRGFMTLFEGEDAPVELMRFTEFDVSDGFSDNNAMIESTVYADYQYINAYVQGTEVMALRETGNGVSAFTAYALGSDNIAAEDFWVFERKSAEEAGGFPGVERKDDEDNNDLTEEQYDKMRVKGETFCAYYWRTLDGACMLQEMDAAVTMGDDWFGTPTDTMRVKYPDNGHPWTAVKYYFADELGPEYIVPEPTAYKPMLVTVTTNEDGEVTGYLSISYLGYGTYRFPDTVSWK